MTDEAREQRIADLKRDLDRWGLNVADRERLWRELRAEINARSPEQAERLKKEGTPHL